MKPNRLLILISVSVFSLYSLHLDIKVKELDKRASGQAFEVILSDPAPEAKGDFPLSPQKKKDWSLEEIQKKLEAAEERRKVRLDVRVHPACLDTSNVLTSGPGH